MKSCQLFFRIIIFYWNYLELIFVITNRYCKIKSYSILQDFEKKPYTLLYIDCTRHLCTFIALPTLAQVRDNTRIYVIRTNKRKREVDFRKPLWQYLCAHLDTFFLRFLFHTRHVILWRCLSANLPCL